MNTATLHRTELLETVTGVTTYDSPGKRLAIIHRGGSMSFITGAQIIQKANCTSDDFHQPINSENIKKQIN
jgi:hypothetical protein